MIEIVRIRFSDIQKVAIDRPHGYLTDVLSHGTVEGDTVVFTAEKYFELREKYSPAMIKPGQPESMRTQPPSVWGPRLWSKLHRRAFEMQGTDDSKWFEAFRLQIPCVKCIMELDQYLLTHPIDWNSYFQWTVDFHNHVNILLGKSIFNPNTGTI